jgi:hypothetical protein
MCIFLMALRIGNNLKNGSRRGVNIINLLDSSRLDKGNSPICGCHLIFRDFNEFVTLNHVTFEGRA